MQIESQVPFVPKIVIKQHTIIRVLGIALFQFLIVIGTRIPYLDVAIALVEYGILVVHLINRNYSKCYILLVLFLSTSFEVSSFVYSNDYQVSYCISNFPIVTAIPYYLIVLVLGSVVFFSYQRQTKEELKKQTSIKSFVYIFVLMMISGVIVYFINLIVNDNGILQTGWYLYDSLLFILNFFSRFIFIITATMLVLVFGDFKNQFLKFYEELLLGMCLSAVVVCAIGWHGYYGSSSDIMLMPLVSSLCPTLIAIAAFKKQNRIVYLFAGLSYVLLSLRYSSLMGSKFYFVVFLSALVYILKTVSNKRIGAIFIALIASIYVFFYVRENTTNIVGSYYFEYKLEQFLRLFDFSGKNIVQWYNSIFGSSRYRVDEFINILYEYIKKPEYFLLGKGIAGTITKRWGITNWDVFAYNFSLNQINSRVYYLMHESVNHIFLQSGILGLVFLVDTIKKLIKKITKNEMFIAAIIWFAFYWIVYCSWQIGSVAMIICLYDYRSENASVHSL